MEKPNNKLTWTTCLATEKRKPYFQDILTRIRIERQQGITIFPKQADVFNAFKLTPIETLKVVILGQDPYHGINQAHGLAFSVRPPTTPPPSLKNIFQELQQDVGISLPKHGCLESWAKQGVLLLNTTLTVQAHQAYSHANIGWTTFTTKVLQAISQHQSGIVFLLWGRHAQNQAQHIDKHKHMILTAPHPSPLSAHRGFLGCKHFSKTNAILKKQNKNPIHWDIPKLPEEGEDLT